MVFSFRELFHITKEEEEVTFILILIFAFLILLHKIFNVFTLYSSPNYIISRCYGQVKHLLSFFWVIHKLKFYIQIIAT